MIENENQYQITQTKLNDLEIDLAALDVPDSNLHPRQILGRRNSLNILIRELQQEIADYERLQRTEIP
jgi:HTH-type transcriptional regulator / antitoxin HipB